MLISTRAMFYPDIAKAFFHRWSEYSKTLKNYQISNSMVCWIKNVLAPYVSLIRSTSCGYKTCFLIIDGCTTHFNDEVNSEIEKNGYVIIVRNLNWRLTKFFSTIVFQFDDSCRLTAIPNGTPVF